ncbi:hypothetical protein J6590_087645 [Homalodisca vitripennis]|nr:hypothetical protein J6590_087645 [Homalodisca vitripennis]
MTSASGQWHCRTGILIEGDSLLNISDQMEQKLFFDKPFRIVVPPRVDWLDGKKPLPPVELELCTDDSKTKSCIRAGIVGVGPCREQVVPMTPYSTVFQA